MKHIKIFVDYNDTKQLKDFLKEILESIESGYNVNWSTDSPKVQESEPNWYYLEKDKEYAKKNNTRFIPC